jgi:Domain of unknown function (DUF4157)
MTYGALERLRTNSHHVAAAARIRERPVDDVLRGSGQPLGTTVREEMEARLGADFSRVRVHTDGAARTSAAEFGARAYTSGEHVVIGDGGAGKHVLAHELTHVIQQRQGPVASTDHGSWLKVSDSSDRDELAAEATAVRVMRVPLSEYRPLMATTAKQSIGAAWHVAGTAREHASVTSLHGPPPTIPPITVQRYFYRPPAMHAEDPKSAAKTEALAPAGRDKDLKYKDDYAAETAPNLKRVGDQDTTAREQAVFTDNPQHSGQMRGYLKDTIKESERVVAVANAVLNELGKSEAGRSTMIGVMQTLDGNFRVANSGYQSDEVKRIVGDLDKVSKAAKSQDPVRSRELKDPMNVEAPVSFVGNVGTDRFKGYLNKDKEKANILMGHVGCAAPKLLLSAVGVGNRLDVQHMTEVWWDPNGSRPKGVMVDGIRYHHLQRVPSCPHCEHNLRILVNWEMRSALKTELEAIGYSADRVQEQLAAQQETMVMYKKLKSAIERTQEAFDFLNAPSLQGARAIWEPLERLTENMVNAVLNRRVTVADYNTQFAEWRAALRKTAAELKSIKSSGVEVSSFNRWVTPARKALLEADSMLKSTHELNHCRAGTLLHTVLPAGP